MEPAQQVSILIQLLLSVTHRKLIFGLILLILIGVICSFQVGKVPAALSNLRTDLGLSLFMASWIISILNVIGTVCGVAMGAFADRVGYRRLMLIGLILLVHPNYQFQEE